MYSFKLQFHLAGVGGGRVGRDRGPGAGIQMPLFYRNMTNITDFHLKDDRGHTYGEESAVK